MSFLGTSTGPWAKGGGWRRGVRALLSFVRGCWPSRRKQNASGAKPEGGGEGRAKVATFHRQETLTPDDVSSVQGSAPPPSPCLAVATSFDLIDAGKIIPAGRKTRRKQRERGLSVI